MNYGLFEYPSEGKPRKRWGGSGVNSPVSSPSKQIHYLPCIGDNDSGSLKIEPRWKSDHKIDGRDPSISPRSCLKKVKSKQEKDFISPGLKKMNTLKDKFDVVDSPKRQKSVTFTIDSPLSPKSPEPVKKNTKSKKSKRKTPKREKIFYAEPKVYNSWGFGKKSNFTPAPSNAKTNQAAITIQRVARGGWQRIKFKLLSLQNKLDTANERTTTELEKLREDTEQRMRDFRTKTKKHCDEKNNELLETEFEASAEASKMIHFLRKENKKLREKNRKIFESNHGLRVNNGRLEDANNQTDTSFGTLNSHAKDINETNVKLNEVVPKYEEGIEKMKKAVEVRQQYCVSEHKIRLLYTKCIGQIVMMAEKKCKDENLVDEIVEYAMEREDQEHDETLPPALDENLANSSDKENEKNDESDAEDCEDGTANNGS